MLAALSSKASKEKFTQLVETWRSLMSGTKSHVERKWLVTCANDLENIIKRKFSRNQYVGLIGSWRRRIVTQDLECCLDDQEADIVRKCIDNLETVVKDVFNLKTARDSTMADNNDLKKEIKELAIVWARRIETSKDDAEEQKVFQTCHTELTGVIPSVQNFTTLANEWKKIPTSEFVDDKCTSIFNICADELMHRVNSISNSSLGTHTSRTSSTSSSSTTFPMHLIKKPYIDLPTKWRACADDTTSVGEAACLEMCIHDLEEVNDANSEEITLEDIKTMSEPGTPPYVPSRTEEYHFNSSKEDTPDLESKKQRPIDKQSDSVSKSIYALQNSIHQLEDILKPIIRFPADEEPSEDDTELKKKIYQCDFDEMMADFETRISDCSERINVINENSAV